MTWRLVLPLLEPPMAERPGRGGASPPVSAAAVLLGEPITVRETLSFLAYALGGGLSSESASDLPSHEHLRYRLFNTVIWRARRPYPWQPFGAE